jgi:hypothetical protein
MGMSNLKNCGSITSRGKKFVFSEASRLAVAPTQFRLWWVVGALCLRLKWLVREASAKIKNK